jgi:hypothetical protein
VFMKQIALFGGSAYISICSLSLSLSPICSPNFSFLGGVGKKN